MDRNARTYTSLVSYVYENEGFSLFCFFRNLRRLRRLRRLSYSFWAPKNGKKMDWLEIPDRVWIVLRKRREREWYK